MKRLVLYLVLLMVAGLAWSASEPLETERPLRIGLTPTFPNDQYRPLEAWRLYMERKLHRRVEFVQRNKYIDTIDLLSLKKLDFAWICDYPYVYFKKQLRLLATPVYNGRPYYRSYLIVPATDTTTTSLAQLKDKVFAFTDPYSNTGYLAPRFALHQAGEEPKHFFRKTFFAWSHRRVLEAVASGLAHGGAVSNHVWETLSIGKSELTSATRIVSTSDEYGFAPIVARDTVSDTDFEVMRQLLLGMATDPEGKLLLKELNLDGFVAGDPQIYLRVEQVMRQLDGK